MKQVIIMPKQYNSKLFPLELMEEKTYKITATFAPKSTDTLRGLTRDEEDRFLPSVIGCKPTSDQWEEKARNFWADFVIHVPKSGLVLNLETVKDSKGAEVKDAKGQTTPENILDYMKYNFAMLHCDVASTPDDIANKGSFPFYLEDLSQMQRDKEKVFEVSKRADIAYIELVKDSNSPKINQAVALLKAPSELAPLTLIEKEMFLSAKKTANPEQFIKVVEDKDLESKATISKLVEAGILAKEGNTYFDGDAVIGEYAEMIAFLKNKTNATRVDILNSKLLAAIK